VGPDRVAPSWRRHAAVLVPVLLIAAAVYRRSLGVFFAQDDITFLSRAAGLEPANWGFRPLSEGLAFRLEYTLFGLDPRGFHAVNLLLHLANIAGVYALTLRLAGSAAAAGAAAALFGLSSIAFTPVHWASGVVELLTAALVLAATLLHIESRGRSRIGLWAAAILALAAMLSKESAVAWVLAIALVEWRSGGNRSARHLLPAAIVTAGFLAAFIVTGQAQRFQASEAYARTGSPLFLAQNLFTYVRWCAALWEPVRDTVAAMDPAAWRVALPALLALGAALWLERARPGRSVLMGAGWWLAFLLPVLPLAHHTYLYYLYIPWAGGAIAAAAAGHALLKSMPGPRGLTIGWAALIGYALLEAHNIEARATATRDALPVDRTMRDAMLLRNALPGLRAAALPSGTWVAFVNPVPRPRFDLIRSAPTRAADLSQRRAYWPLEAALRGGETLRLFVPEVRYRGFATTLPPEWEDAECFLFEQRGWLRPWGRGQEALMHQAGTQLETEQWAAAESTFLRVRSLADTLPAALSGQVTALVRLGRRGEAEHVAKELLRRWPDRPEAAQVRELIGPAARE
jgi:hypothetical protein